METQTLSVRQAAQVLGVGTRSLYQAVRDGRMPVLRIGRKPKFRIPRVAVKWLLEHPESFSPAVESEASAAREIGVSRRDRQRRQQAG